MTGIGQGYLLTTPLQLVVMAAQIANGGYRVQPTLIARDPPKAASTGKRAGAQRVHGAVHGLARAHSPLDGFGQ